MLCSFKKTIYIFFYKQSEHYNYTILILNFLIYQLLLLIYFLILIFLQKEIKSNIILPHIDTILAIKKFIFSYCHYIILFKNHFKQRSHVQFLSCIKSKLCTNSTFPLLSRNSNAHNFLSRDQSQVSIKPVQTNE